MSSIELSNLFSVKGIVVVITGGGSGIGRMLATGLEANGAKVYIIGRRLESLQKVAKEAVHGNIIPIQGDVTSKADLLRAVDTIAAADGFINVLVANSGIGGPASTPPQENPTLAETRDFLWNTDPDSFTEALHVNTTAVYFTTLAFLNLLDAGNKRGNVEQKSQVIAISSVAAHHRNVAAYAYAASKAAVNHMFKMFSTSWAPYQIRANIIAPGIYPSEMVERYHGAASTSGVLDASRVPLQRAGTIEDMAGLICFLTSRAGAYLNGNIVLSDGGRTGILHGTY